MQYPQQQFSFAHKYHPYYSVWAPAATSATLHLEDATIPLVAAEQGWWTCDVERQVGQRYKFSTSETAAAFPDPRSCSQPLGIHGPSEVRDHTPVSLDGYRGATLQGQVIYELHVGTFSAEGTFGGVIKQLDYLAELGVTAIELMPVQPFGGTRNWGYDGVSWLAVHEPYGGAEGLKDLVRAAHKRGIAVVMDLVFNHFGPDGNYAAAFGPYEQPANTGWGNQVNLCGSHSDEVRALILDAVAQWLHEFGVDGIRLDAVHAFDDRGAYSIMEQIQMVADAVSAKTGVPRWIIAESDLNDPRLMSHYGLAAQWVDDIHHSLHVLTSGEAHGYFADYADAGIEGLAKGLASMYFFDGSYSSFRARHHGRRIPASVEPHSGVVYTTTHDQTGNRARGDRPSQYLSQAQLALRAATVLCSPYTPMLFMGEEYGARTPFPFFCSHESAELNKATAEGRLHEFAYHGWDDHSMPAPDDPETFESAKLQIERNALWSTYRELIAARHTYSFAETSYADFEVRHGKDWLIMQHPNAIFVGNYSNTNTEVPELGISLVPWEYRIIARD